MFHRLAVMASARSRPAFAGFVATPPAPTLRLGGVRQFAKRSRRRKLKNKRKDKTSTAPPAPLSKVMRLFVAKVHPDKFGAFPVQQEVNEESLSALTGFLSNVSNPEEDFMPAQKIAMKFYVQDDEQLKQVNFQLRTTGGDCKNLVKKQLTALFESVGVPQPEFTWDDKFWKSQESLERQNWDDDEDDDAEVHQAAQAPRTVEEILQAMDPILQAIAAVPWLNENDRISVFVKTKAFDDLEAQGWKNLKPAAEVWCISIPMSLTVFLVERSPCCSIEGHLARRARFRHSGS